MLFYEQCEFYFQVVQRYLDAFHIHDLIDFPAKIHLVEDVLKTSFVLFSEDVFKTSWSRPIYSSWSYIFKTSSRHFQGVFKTSCKKVFKTSSRCFEEVLIKTSWFKISLRSLAKTSSRRLQKVFERFLKPIIKVSYSC